MAREAHELRWIRPPQQARSQETLGRILDAAEALVAEKGFDDTPISEIVQRAGSSVGAFYTRFPAKDALLALSIAEQNTSLDALLARLQTEQASLTFERLRINGLPAARTRVSDRDRFVELTLIGYRGDVYAVLGQSQGRNASQYAKTFDATARSFRSLRASERRSLVESPTTCGACASMGTVRSVVSVRGATLTLRGRPNSSNTSTVKV